MTIILFLLAIGLAVLKVSGTIAISWLWVGVAFLVAILLPRILSGSLFGTFFKDRNSDTTDPNFTNACGCSYNQLVGMQRRNIFGKWKDAGLATCDVALGRISDSKKWNITGCV